MDGAESAPLQQPLEQKIEDVEIDADESVGRLLPVTVEQLPENAGPGPAGA